MPSCEAAERPVLTPPQDVSLANAKYVYAGVNTLGRRSGAPPFLPAAPRTQPSARPPHSQGCHCNGTAPAKAVRWNRLKCLAARPVPKGCGEAESRDMMLVAGASPGTQTQDSHLAFFYEPAS